MAWKKGPSWRAGSVKRDTIKHTIRPKKGNIIMKFMYTALDAQGREVLDLIEAVNQKEAVQKIRDMGYFPVSVKTEDDERSFTEVQMTKLKNGVSKLGAEVRERIDLGDGPAEPIVDPPKNSFEEAAAEAIKAGKSLGEFLEEQAKEGNFDEAQAETKTEEDDPRKELKKELAALWEKYEPFIQATAEEFGGKIATWLAAHKSKAAKSLDEQIAMNEKLDKLIGRFDLLQKTMVGILTRQKEIERKAQQ